MLKYCDVNGLKLMVRSEMIDEFAHVVAGLANVPEQAALENVLGPLQLARRQAVLLQPLQLLAEDLYDPLDPVGGGGEVGLYGPGI